MGFRILATGLGLGLVTTSLAGAQAPSTARVETAPVESQAQDRFRVPAALVPSRKVVVVAPADGVLRSLSVPVGATIREGQEIGQFDRAEAEARVRIAQAVVKQHQAQLDAARVASAVPSGGSLALYAAQLDEARAKADLAQLGLDRCILRAPFAGRVVAISVSAGQYLPKGGAVAEVADVADLRALVPLERRAAKVGDEAALKVEGRAASGRIQAIVPLPEAFAPLRELATPLAGAWVAIDNTSGALEPGQRVVTAAMPDAPLAILPGRAVREGPVGPEVQVLRNELVADLPVRVLGEAGAERLQVSGAFRPGDVLIVSSTVPLLAGTLVRFGGEAGGPIEATAPRPDEVGQMAGITPPSRSTLAPSSTSTPNPSTSRPGVAPIGAPGSALPRGTPRPASPAPSPVAPARPPTPANSVPF